MRFRTKLRSIPAVVPAAVAAVFMGLPLPPIPVPTPGGLLVPMLQSELATPLQLPAVISPVDTSAPALPAVGAAPATSTPPVPVAATGPVAGASSGTNGGGTPGAPGGGDPPQGLPIPFTTIVLSSPLDVALAVALGSLPLLLGIWLLVFARTLGEARRA